MSIKTALYSAILITALTTSFYVYYKNSQSKIAMLTETNIKLNLAVEQQQQTIATIQAKYDKQVTAIHNLSTANASLYKEKETLATKLMKHDLEELSRRKPALVESRINNGTKELFSSFNSISSQ